jgi:hypothetical protein
VCRLQVASSFATHVVDSVLLVCQSRRTAAVAAFLSVAMVAGVALTYFSSNVELLISGSSEGSPHADAALALDLIRAAPHASVCGCLFIVSPCFSVVSVF